jgi:amidase
VPAAGGLNVDAVTIAELHGAMASGQLTAAALTQACLERIDALDAQLGSVLAVRPVALADAEASDERRRAGARPRPLEGVPVLLKDNVAVAGVPTTAGSRALLESMPADAPLVSRLRDAGAIILGKTNLSEWANFRDEHSTSGWSAVGGQTRNPHVLDRSTSGSSSGSAAAVAASLAQVAVGTETDGSIISPAAVCGVVGAKPTFGTVPGTGIVPLSSHQDTAGPIARHVADAALLHAVLCGTPPPDLRGATLRGARIGVWRPAGLDAAVTDVFDAALASLSAAGATATDAEVDPSAIQDAEWPALLAEFRHDIDAYLAVAPDAAARTLAGLIAFNKADPDELAHFGQSLFEQALTARDLDDPTYREQRATATREARAVLDRALAGVDAILTPSNDPAWPIDYAAGDIYHVETTTPAAVAGYPSISVPAGFAGLLPVGVSLIGRAGKDADLWRLACAFEQAVPARRAPTYRAGAG